MSEASDFRSEMRAWIATNCPDGARGAGPVATGSTKIKIDKDVAIWLERCAARGLTAPTWPQAYGGAGLTGAQARIFNEELAAVKARAPLMGMGLSMIGPTLLEFGTEEQKQRHLPKIVRGEVQWCQGYSEPGAGSDLAALRTRAEDAGDHFILNGQKIWTSGGQFADWMFALVRTNFEAPKHEGISFVLLTMDQPGVRVRPIRLISGNSPFCETFFENAIARKEDLIGRLNQGWSVGKRLLQYERSGIGGLAGGAAAGGRRRVGGSELTDLAKRYVGEVNGKIAESAVRDAVLRQEMQSRAFALTIRRSIEANRSGKTPGEETSIFKSVGAQLQRDGAELRQTLMGTQGLGWEGTAFNASEIETTRAWLSTKATTIYGGTNEVQMNIVAKRVLGLPD